MVQSRLLLQFPELVHGFSTKEDGSLAVPRSGAVSLEQVINNRHAFLDALGIDMVDLVLAKQLHGNKVAKVTPGHRGRAEENESPFAEADGLWTTDPTTYLAIFAADCLPVFFYDPAERRTAAVHAGWRGIAAEIIPEAVQQLKIAGSSLKSLYVWIGPHIHVCHYQMDKEADSYVEKEAAFGHQEGAIVEREGIEFLDLTRLAMQQLESQGVPTDQIEVGPCTACQSDHYYSYKASFGKLPGLMMGTIGIRNNQ